MSFCYNPVLYLKSPLTSYKILEKQDVRPGNLFGSELWQLHAVYSYRSIPPLERTELYVNIKFERPELALMEAERTMEGIPSIALFSDSRYQKVLEKWCAGMFGLGYRKYLRDCEIGVNDTSKNLDADFFLRVDKKVWPFQLVEVPDPSRKRGDEYKGFADGSIKSIPYEPEKGHMEGLDWLKNGIEKKVKKNYAGSENLNLLVYANFTARQLDYARLREALAGFKGRFASIWIVTSTHVCSMYSGPELGEISRWGEVRDISHYYA